jgi:hypothetical protein
MPRQRAEPACNQFFAGEHGLIAQECRKGGCSMKMGRGLGAGAP